MSECYQAADPALVKAACDVLAAFGLDRNDVCKAAQAFLIGSFKAATSGGDAMPRISGGNGISVSEADGVYTISLSERAI